MYVLCEIVEQEGEDGEGRLSGAAKDDHSAEDRYLLIMKKLQFGKYCYIFTSVSCAYSISLVLTETLNFSNRPDFVFSLIYSFKERNDSRQMFASQRKKMVSRNRFSRSFSFKRFILTQYCSSSGDQQTCEQTNTFAFL